MTQAMYRSLCSWIIPYQELLGNYDGVAEMVSRSSIIPYQELLGNYDITTYVSCAKHYYTIPRAIREL